MWESYLEREKNGKITNDFLMTKSLVKVHYFAVMVNGMKLIKRFNKNDEGRGWDLSLPPPPVK